MNSISDIMLKLRLITIKNIKNDFSNLDLSNKDLSNFSIKFWENVFLNNTNFSNSKINFNPQYLPKNVEGIRKLENVNFENVDLSYLKAKDFERITIENVNLKNTGLKINFNEIKYPSKTLYGVTLNENIILDSFQKIDLKTLELNPNYPFTDIQIIQAITQTFDHFFCSIVKESRNDEMIDFIFEMTEKEYYEKMREYIDEIILTLKKYNRFNMISIIEKMLEHSDIDDVFSFLTAQNVDMHFKQIDFTKEEIDILNTWEIKNNLTFENCTFDIDYKEAKEGYYPFKGKYNHLIKWNNCSISNDLYLNKKITKIPNTPFSTHTGLYVKIGNKCNGSCSFCKNNTEEIKKADIEKIINNLCDINILSHLNEIYFGGGEPSLYLEEIKNMSTKLRRLLYEKNIPQPNLYMFTNGGGNWQKIYNYLFPYFNIILSRHEIDDERNKKIVGVEYELQNPAIKELIMYKKLILSLTCSDLNMRKNFLEEYFEFGRKLGVRDFIIQSLESKTNITIPKLDEYLNDFKTYLINQGLDTERKIVSTSYFDLYLLSGNGCTVALKKYFEPEKLEEHMKYEAKHSFDLGMDTDGAVYNDFQMIKKLKK